MPKAKRAKPAQAAPPAAEPKPKRIALLICNGSLPTTPATRLPGPAKDADHLSAALADAEVCRFHVQTLLDQGLLEIRYQIARVCAEAGENDTLLIYYSGSGLTGADGTLCLLVGDSRGDFPDATGLDADFILSQLRRSRCRKIVLLIDGCHSGAFFANNRGIPNGLYAITSCAADEMCADTPDGGAFTLALCAGIRYGAADSDGDGRVTIDDLHDFAQRWLRERGFMGSPQKWVWNVPEPIYVASVPRPVFLSYAREDMAAADQLLQALEAEGISVWIDRDGIQSGSWKERVTDGLNQSRALVVLLTPNSLASGAVRKELAFAAKKQVPIIPVLVGELADESLPDWYTLDYDELHRHALGDEYAACVKKLATAIRKLKRPTAHAAAAP